ncbi:7290_t:CDS:1, partial [Dentiscutata heterogama]
VYAKENELVKTQEVSIQALAKDNIVKFTNPYKVTGKEDLKKQAILVK